MLILNLKTYPQVSGKSLLSTLQMIAEVVAQKPELHGKLLVAPAMVELALAKSMQPQLEFVAQSADNIDQGSTTGHTPLSLVKELGVEYVFANHSESRLVIEKTVELIGAAKQLDLKVIACCENVKEAGQILGAAPYAILYEPPELIGSGVSVTTKPDTVADFVHTLNGANVLPIIGAGITTAADVRASFTLKAQGVGLASAFAKAEDKKIFLLELASAML